MRTSEPNYRSREWLYQKYVTETLSSCEIADIESVSDTCIRSWLRRLDIQVRTCSDSQKLTPRSEAVQLRKKLDAEFKQTDTYKDYRAARVRDTTSKAIAARVKNGRAKLLARIGERFGSLLILDVVFGGNCTKCTYVCDCGIKKTVHIQGIIKDGGSRRCNSCSKLSSDPWGAEIRLYKHQCATRRGLEWSISDEEYQSLSVANCFYCGAEPAERSRNLKLRNGIDRINNDIGYVTGNCVTACKVCNVAKSDKDVDEFISWVHKVHDFQIKKAA